MHEEYVGKDLLADAGIVEVLETARAALMDSFGNVADLLHVSVLVFMCRMCTNVCIYTYMCVCITYFIYIYIYTYCLCTNFCTGTSWWLCTSHVHIQVGSSVYIQLHRSSARKVMRHAYKHTDQICADVQSL